jgi:uncharacterized protein YeaO (DUF488 family)
MIHTKCILHPKSPKDGVRVSVMSRHTLNDGITPHPDIKPGTFNTWLKIFAPADKLVGDYYKRGLSFDEFKRRYLEYLRLPEIQERLRKFAKLALKQDFTLMCIEEIADNCHRKILAEEMQRLEPTLKVLHK